MQQKYLWGGAALFVLGAAMAYVSVDYAAHHPTSLLARFGMATMFAGMNPNPLSDLSPAITGEQANQGHAVDPNAHQPDAQKSVGNPAEETIEPIQVETLPPPTKEPPIKIDDDEWASILEAITTQTGSFQNLGPKPMPYAEENPDASVNGVNVSEAVQTISRALSQNLLLWLFSVAPLQVPPMDLIPPAQASDPTTKEDPPRNDTMEFRPSDAGRYPLVNGNPF